MSARRRFPQWDDPYLVLYHGTLRKHADAILANGIDPARGSPHTDFGRGFYTTTNHAQADEWADSRASEQGEHSAVLMLTVDRLALARLRHLAFLRPANDYWSLVENCRNDAPYAVEQGYDVVYGPVAKRWWGDEDYAAFPDFDQISFHGDAAKSFLNNKIYCEVEVVP